MNSQTVPIFAIPKRNGAVAQMVEQRTENPCVGSSILPSTTKTAFYMRRRPFAFELWLVSFYCSLSVYSIGRSKDFPEEGCRGSAHFLFFPGDDVVLPFHHPESVRPPRQAGRPPSRRSRRLGCPSPGTSDDEFHQGLAAFFGELVFVHEVEHKRNPYGIIGKDFSRVIPDDSRICRLKVGRKEGIPE